MSKKLSRGAKAPKPEGTKTPAPETARINLNLGVEQYRRLFLHALMSNRSAGDIVTALIDANLREFRIQRMSTASVETNDRHDEPPCVRESTPAPALQDAA